jgi:membrane-bound lytic murein transglycosylase F
MIKLLSFVIFSIATFMVYETSQGQPSDAATKESAAEEIVKETITKSEAMPTHTTNEQSAEMAQLPVTISEFDPIMRKVGQEQGHDWRLMSAIAYNETRFREDLVSKRGAVGIMQIRPVVAHHFNIPEEQLANTETNVRIAAMLLSELEGLLKLPASTPNDDRLSIILASYNAGIGHIHDACRLARSEGADPHSWENISHYLELMSTPEYYNREEVRHGKFNGSRQTLGYVREVMKVYHEYCTIAS